MSTADLALRLRTSRPKNYVDYTTQTSRSTHTLRTQTRTSAKKKRSPRQYQYASQQLFPRKIYKQESTAQNLYPALALEAISIADPTYEEIAIDDLPAFTERTMRLKVLFSVLCLGFGVFTLFGAGFITFNNLVLKRTTQEQVQALGASTFFFDANGVREGTGDNPAESAVSEDALLNYVPDNPADPRYIRIPSVGVISRVKPLGIISATQSYDLPHNVNDAGWYNGSSQPGAKLGSIVLLGHESGRSTPGVFNRVDALQNEDKIIIENGEGRTYNYYVYKTETLQSDEDIIQKVEEEKTYEHILALVSSSKLKNSKNSRDTSNGSTIVFARQIN